MFFKKKITFLIFGLVLLHIVLQFDKRILNYIVFYSSIFVFALLFLTLLINDNTKGSIRWINIISFSLQPSEFLKPLCISLVSIIITNKKNRYNTYNTIFIAYTGIFVLLILEPDFGSTIINIVLLINILFLMGTKIFFFLLVIKFFIIFILIIYIFIPYVALRINNYLHIMLFDNYKINHQIDQSILSYINGELLGRGIGKGAIKYVLPDSYTDFIFAIIAEEFGIIFCIIMIIIFYFYSLKIIYYINNICSINIIYINLNFIIFFIMQSIINICVTLNLFPTKGLTLPFISYGGSSFIAYMFYLGIYCNVNNITIANFFIRIIYIVNKLFFNLIVKKIK